MKSLLLLAANIPADIWTGYVLTRLWTWFAMPLGAPRLGVPSAMGLVLMVRLAVLDASVVGMLAQALDATAPKAEAVKRHAVRVVLGYAMPTVLFGVGFLVSRFM